ncbi:MAG: hypothetical protein RNU03_13385 [Candidatus Sedimenticola sp. (ex Thyasira tokunagai)]
MIHWPLGQKPRHPLPALGLKKFAVISVDVRAAPFCGSTFYTDHLLFQLLTVKSFIGHLRFGRKPLDPGG